VNVFTYTDARQKLATVLDTAARSGAVLITRRDGSVFKLEPVQRGTSPFADVKGVKTKLTTAELLDCIRESRER